jgi:hypothetical protein
MLPSVISTLAGLFFKPRRMDIVQGFDLALKPSAKHDTETFLFFFLAEAMQAKSDPYAEVLDRLIVDQIVQKKTEEPEHELLVIHTHDTVEEGKKRQFILERMISTDTPPSNLNMNIYTDDDIDNVNETTPTPFTTKIFDTIRKVVDAIFAAISSESESGSVLASDQRSMEEGTSRSFSPSASVASESLSITDSVTVSVSEAADSVSDTVADSLDRDRLGAFDRFLGQSFTTLPRWTGESMRDFSPHRLTFFEFVVLAYAVHLRYPKYTTLKMNCMFYASLVYEAAEQYGGNADTGNKASHSQLGRWKGVKVNRVDPEMVSKVVLRFKRVLARHIASVSLCSFKLFSLIQSK